MILYYHNNLINFFVIRTICRELQQKNVFDMCFVLEDKQQKEIRIRRKKIEEDQDRERSIERVSPSLTAFRNAAKNKKKKQEKRERDKQANPKILSMRTKLKHRTGIRTYKEEAWRHFCMLLNSKMFTIFYVTFSF